LSFALSTRVSRGPTNVVRGFSPGFFGKVSKPGWHSARPRALYVSTLKGRPAAAAVGTSCQPVALFRPVPPASRIFNNGNLFTPSGFMQAGGRQ